MTDSQSPHGGLQDQEVRALLDLLAWETGPNRLTPADDYHHTFHSHRALNSEMTLGEARRLTRERDERLGITGRRKRGARR